MQFVAFIIITIMIAFCALCLSGCAALPQLFQAAETIADDDAIDITISREAITKNTDVSVHVDIINKDLPVQK